MLETFLASKSENDQFFSVWGHGYEFDFGTKNANWNNSAGWYQSQRM